MTYRLSIALFGKGSINHLHRIEVVKAFARRKIKIKFLVRSDYLHLLEKIKGCDYSSCSISGPHGWQTVLLSISGYLRSLYPSQDIGRRAMFEASMSECNSFLSVLFRRTCRLLARYCIVVHLLSIIESIFYRSTWLQGVDPRTMDQLLLLGVGSVNSESEAYMSWWAKKHDIPTVHIVGNYDNLSTKGYRGVSIERLLVWGPNMREDAIKLQGIQPKRITEIGSIRYNTAVKSPMPGKAAFFNSIGLDPKKKTILFAGFIFESHYFEMLEVHRQLLRENANTQMILRVYPNKKLMKSIYIEPLLKYVDTMKDVYVSLADPHYKHGERGKEVMQIEEDELWPSLKWSDIIIQFYSTIALEACIFDKPVLNIYYPDISEYYERPPKYRNYSLHFHHRRLSSLGAVQTVRDRIELIEMIRSAFDFPEKGFSERKMTVEKECGSLDGRACDRLVQSCYEEWSKKNVHHGLSSWRDAISSKN